MDSSRFDRITRNLASGSSRRSLMKAALGSIGGAVLASRLGADADAARRTATSPAPTPVRCPGQQIPCSSSCCCPSGSDACGAACCPTGQSVCCDGACCNGQCIDEEIYCPSNSIACNEICLEPGQCCADADCPRGQMCSNNQCINDCLPNGASGCNSNVACCSGICQGGQCFATLAGNCSSICGALRQSANELRSGQHRWLHVRDRCRADHLRGRGHLRSRLRSLPARGYLSSRNILLFARRPMRHALRTIWRLVLSLTALHPPFGCDERRAAGP